MRVFRCNGQVPNANKTNEDWSVRAGQGELANRRRLGWLSWFCVSVIFHTLLFGINRLRSDGLPHCWAKDRCSGAFVQPEALVFFRTRAPALQPREITRSLLLLPFTFACFQQLGHLLFARKLTPITGTGSFWPRTSNELYVTAQIEFSFYERYFNP